MVEQGFGKSGGPPIGDAAIVCETPCFGEIGCGMVIAVWYGMDGMVVTIWGPLATLLVRSADQQNGLPS